MHRAAVQSARPAVARSAITLTNDLPKRMKAVRVVVGRLVCAFVLAAAADASGQSNASGSFDTPTVKLDIAGAYGYWGTTAEARVIRVAIANAEFKPELLDPWVDRGAVVREKFANEQVKVAYFDFDPDGRYRGFSYRFTDSDGCAPCNDVGVRSTVRASGGRLKGKLARTSASAGASFDVNIDVAIPDKTWGTALPADGGEPARAVLAYHRALATGDVPALRASSDARGKAIIDKFDQQGDARAYANFRWDELHRRLQSLHVVGGFVNGDRAVVLFDGSGSGGEPLYGEAVVRREGSAWRVDDELVQTGRRPPTAVR